MKLRQADIFIIAACCTLLILAVSMSGCTSQNTGTAGPVTTPARTDTTSTMATPAVTSQTFPEQTAPAVTTGTQTTILAARSPVPISLKINSADKQTKVYTMIPKPGRIFLVLNITVQNNGIEKGFDLTDSSLSLAYAKAGTSPVPSITTQVRGGLENPIIMPTRIEQNDTRTGQVVFGVADNSGRYTLNLIGTDGAIIVSSASITV
jgi:hypothetical protein